MGLGRLLTSTKNQAVIRYLQDELKEYIHLWSQLPTAHREHLEGELPDQLAAVQFQAGNMSAKGQIEQGIALRHQARKTRDRDLVGGIALWVQGAWLEAEGRQLAELGDFKGTLEFASEAGMTGIAEIVRRASETEGYSEPVSLTPERHGKPVEIADRVLTHIDGECLSELSRRAGGGKPPNLPAAGALIGAYEAVFNAGVASNPERAKEQLAEALRLLEVPGDPDNLASQIIALEASTRDHANSPVTRWRVYARDMCSGEQEVRNFDLSRAEDSSDETLDSGRA